MSKLRFDMNRHLDRIAAFVLLVFVLPSLFLLVTMTRHFRPQSAHAEVTPEIQAELQHLQDTTEELQETVDELQAQAEAAAPEISESLETLDQTLADVSQQIAQIGDEVSASPTEESTARAPVPDTEPLSSESADHNPAFEDDLLTLTGWTVGILSIFTAAVWALVVLLKGKRRIRPSPLIKDKW